MRLHNANGADMTVARKIGHGIGGFTLSLVAVVLTAVSLQFILSFIWNQPQSFLVAYSTALAVSITAIATSWACLLKGLRNKAIIRGVWYQIYAIAGLAVVGLLAALYL